MELSESAKCSSKISIIEKEGYAKMKVAYVLLIAAVIGAGVVESKEVSCQDVWHALDCANILLQYLAPMTSKY